MHALSAKLGRLLQLSDGLGLSIVQAGFLDGLASGHLVSASLVCDETGSFVGPDGSSSGLGGATDRLWLGALRRKSKLVLTSGLTFRIERYKMPKVADLAVFTKAGIDATDLVIRPGQRLHTMSAQHSYTEALNSALSLGYSHIHVEFGPTGIRELMTTSKLTLWISSPSRQGLFAGAEALGVEVSPVAEVAGLWLGKASSAAWQRL